MTGLVGLSAHGQHEQLFVDPLVRRTHERTSEVHQLVIGQALTGHAAYR